MGLGAAARRWIPPALHDAAGALLPPRLRRFQVATSWAAAERQCIGYEASSVRDFAAGRSPSRTTVPRPTSRDVQLIAALGICIADLRPTSTLRVLDYGGALGHYRDVAALAFPRLSWEWTVVETPAVVAAAAQLVTEQTHRWTTDLRSALTERWDFVLASASLNYVPEPVETLKLLGGAAPYVLLTRLPLWPIARHMPAVQRVRRRDRRGTYPTWFFSEATFLEEVESFGRVVLRFDVSEDTALVAGHRCSYTGLLVRAQART